jgi:hypothetical protein
MAKKKAGAKKSKKAAKAAKPVKKAAAKKAAKGAKKAAAKKAVKKAPAKAAKKGVKPGGRTGAKAAVKKAQKKAAPKKAAARKVPARPVAPVVKKPARVAAPILKKAARPAPAKPKTAPGPKRAKSAPIRGAIPSSLVLEGGSSAARSGREDLLQHIKERTETSPAITAGDVDADWQLAYSSGDEAPGGDNPTPDQDVVDESGEALGVNYEEGEELQGAAKIEDRDKHRWELDPASKDDFDE